MTRRRSSLRIRCAQALGLAVLVGVLVAAIGTAADYLATIRWR